MISLKCQREKLEVLSIFIYFNINYRRIKTHWDENINVQYNGDNSQMIQQYFAIYRSYNTKKRSLIIYVFRAVLD